MCHDLVYNPRKQAFGNTAPHKVQTCAGFGLTMLPQSGSCIIVKYGNHNQPYYGKNNFTSQSLRLSLFHSRNSDCHKFPGTAGPSYGSGLRLLSAQSVPQIQQEDIQISASDSCSMSWFQHEPPGIPCAPALKAYSSPWGFGSRRHGSTPGVLLGYWLAHQPRKDVVPHFVGYGHLRRQCDSRRRPLFSKPT